MPKILPCFWTLPLPGPTPSYPSLKYFLLVNMDTNFCQFWTMLGYQLTSFRIKICYWLVNLSAIMRIATTFLNFQVNCFMFHVFPWKPFILQFSYVSIINIWTKFGINLYVKKFMGKFSMQFKNIKLCGIFMRINEQAGYFAEYIFQVRMYGSIIVCSFLVKTLFL